MERPSGAVHRQVSQDNVRRPLFQFLDIGHATASGGRCNATANDSAAAKCADAAVEGAKPLSNNAYKVQLVKAAVKRAVLATRA